MIALILSRSWWLRSALGWLYHRPALGVAPVAVVGTLVVTGLLVPGWLVTVSGPVTVVLVVAALVGQRLHSGAPCRWCPVTADDAGEVSA
jgi:hypothetical protein